VQAASLLASCFFDACESPAQTCLMHAGSSLRILMAAHLVLSDGRYTFRLTPQQTEEAAAAAAAAEELFYKPYSLGELYDVRLCNLSLYCPPWRHLYECSAGLKSL